MYYSLDRIEGAWAVLVDDDGVSVDVLLTELPGEPQRGRIYRRESDAYIEDVAEEQARRERIKAMQERLRRR